MRTLRLVVAVAVLLLSLTFVVSAQQQQLVASSATPAPTTNVTTTKTSPMPEYTGVFYTQPAEGKLVALPRTTPKFGKFGNKVSVVVPATTPTTETAPTLIVKIEGSGDPASVVEVALVEGGKIPMGDSMSVFAKMVDVDIRPVGNRVFEVTAKPVSGGDYAIALKSPDPFSVPEVFLFRVK